MNPSLINEATKDLKTFLVTVAFAVIPKTVQAIPVIGQLIRIFVPVLMEPIAREIAKMGVFAYYDLAQGIKLYRYNLKLGKLQLTLGTYKGGPMTPEEKKVSDEFDKAFDDLIRAK
jgi:hypothetical protein